MRFQRWGFNIGPLHICWWDLWGSRPLLEISWIDRMGRGRVLIGLALVGNLTHQCGPDCAFPEMPHVEEAE